jgi:hypothetical protein
MRYVALLMGTTKTSRGRCRNVKKVVELTGGMAPNVLCEASSGGRELEGVVV